jgi:predicted MFS family arabinose efflux permease
MTAVSGLAGSFAQLALARVGVGIGEAATGPATQSMFADLFARRQRTVALAIFGVATPVGLMTAFVAGGWLHEAIGWRRTLVALGLPGLALALAIRTTVREPQRGASDAAQEPGRAYDVRATIAYLWGLRTMRHVAMGASLSIFAGWALLVWGPSFLIRVHGLSTGDAGLWLGLASGIGGIAGTLGSGMAAQRLAARDERWLMLVPSLTCAAAIVFVVLFLMLPDAASATPMAFGVMLFGPAMLGPVMAATQSLAKVRMRAMAAALVAMTFNIFGSGPGPLVTGALSDLLAPSYGNQSIRYALLICCTLALAGAALHFRFAAKHLEADLTRAAQAD